MGSDNVKIVYSFIEISKKPLSLVVSGTMYRINFLFHFSLSDSLSAILSTATAGSRVDAQEVANGSAVSI